MPFLLDQDYPKSIVVKKALNSLMGLYCKEKKKKGNAKEKNTTSYPTHLLCCLWLQAIPGVLTSWVEYLGWSSGSCPRMVYK